MPLAFGLRFLRFPPWYCPGGWPLTWLLWGPELDPLIGSSIKEAGHKREQLVLLVQLPLCPKFLPCWSYQLWETSILVGPYTNQFLFIS